MYLDDIIICCGYYLIDHGYLTLTYYYKAVYYVHYTAMPICWLAAKDAYLLIVCIAFQLHGMITTLHEYSQDL